MPGSGEMGQLSVNMPGVQTSQEVEFQLKVGRRFFSSQLELKRPDSLHGQALSSLPLGLFQQGLDLLAIRQTDFLPWVGVRPGTFKPLLSDFPCWAGRH